MASSLLEVRNLSVRFGGVHALTDVDLDVREGELLGLIGPNGAGKTTFIDAIAGFVASTGIITFDGQDLAGVPVHERARRGLGRTWQADDLFSDLTVQENLTVSAGRPGIWETIQQFVGASRPPDPRILATLERFGLSEFLDTTAEELSQGQRKLVGIARALASGPRLLFLDEPAAGLNTSESEILGTSLRQVVDDGTPLLLVDHDMGLVMRICDRIVVLEFGRVIATGTPDEVRADPRVIEAYLGSGTVAEEPALRAER